MSDVYLWESFDRLGREALERRDFTQAIEAFKSAVATAEELQAFDRICLSLRNLAACFQDTGQLHDAWELLKQTLELAKSNLGDLHSQTVEAHRDLSHVCKELGFLDKSEYHLRIVLGRERQDGEKESAQHSLSALAQLAQARQNFSKATKYYQEILEIREELLGPEHPELAQALMWYSSACFQSKNHGQGHRSYGAGLCSYWKSNSQRSPCSWLRVYWPALNSWSSLKQLDIALAHQKRALDIYLKELGEEGEQIWSSS